ncbi:helix-turn-helix domain-containing protein [Desulfotomaculum sp. 1211_IL3151]|uniref:helix-turn-helix domain-containing protein n=1 Tax=Desulfotomaculum sp. 1211_IL3151 TaxID=3084055 RepID=UPI002FD950E4
MKKQYTVETLPDVLTAQHIADFLIISRRRVYELFDIKPEAGGIPNFEIGQSRRVEKQDLISWIKARKREREQKVG